MRATDIVNFFINAACIQMATKCNICSRSKTRIFAVVGLWRIILSVLILEDTMKYIMAGSDLELCNCAQFHSPKDLYQPTLPSQPHSVPMKSLDYQLSLSRTSNAPCVCFKLRQNGDKVTQDDSFTRVYVSLRHSMFMFSSYVRNCLTYIRTDRNLNLSKRKSTFSCSFLLMGNFIGSFYL